MDTTGGEGHASMPQIAQRYTARTADKHVLYMEAVQAPETDARFLDRLYRRHRGRQALVLKEDFCGTAAISCEWARLGRNRLAVGVDLDPDVLEWGRAHNMTALSEAARERVVLLCEDVRAVQEPKADILAAFNFSYSTFKTREELKGYLRAAVDSLADDGLLILDVFGGGDAHELHLEKREHDGFTYVWDLDYFSPVTNECLYYIHFEFPDGSKMRKAFTYDWRLWSLPELRELFHEVGLRNVHVLWEGTDEKTGEGNGKFRRTEKGEPCPAWIAYVVGLK